MQCSKPLSLFDQLVGEQKERFRDREPKHFRSLEVDNQVELGRLLHGQVGGPRASCARSRQRVENALFQTRGRDAR